MASSAAQPEPGMAMTPRERRRAIIAATTGNGIEFYDFITFTYFSIQIGHTFFPSEDKFVSLMAALATFGAGFATRPIGAYFLGGYADRKGRKPSMLLSMMLMGIGMVLLVVTPGYATIGIAAPIIAVIARLIQGFALGGEVGSATSYLIESSPPEKRALTVSWQGASQQVAATLGTVVGIGLATVLSDADYQAYAWRIALAIGALIIPFALWIRSSLPETLHGPAEPDEIGDTSFRSYRRILVLGFLMIGAGTIANYILQYMATFGQDTLKLSAQVSLTAEFGNNFVGLGLALLGGWLADRYGRRPLMVWPQLVLVLAIMPIAPYLISGSSAMSFIGSVTLLSALATTQYSAVYAVINESLPRAVRARAFALVYSLPVAILGGTTQLFVTWLIHVTGEPISLAWYLTFVSAIGLVAMYLTKETLPRFATRSPQVGEPIPM